jgi:hypothetical protein
LQTIENKVINNKVKNIIRCNIEIEQFKINIIEKKYIQVSDIKKSFKIMFYPTYVRRELFLFLFLYLALGIFTQIRKDLYFEHAYILN